MGDKWPGHLGNYLTVLIQEGRGLQYHGYTFSSEQKAKPFFLNQSVNATDNQWNPSLGNGSVAWIASDKEFHVLAQKDSFVLHLVEQRIDPEDGPWPTVALNAAEHWLKEFAQVEC
jgi:hypothetical protein